tara:strand:- start:122 stop:274 length:153 start_codon:yes stop_codon:yes gene_type:complete
MEALKSLINYVPGVYCDGADKHLSQIDELIREGTFELRWRKARTIKLKSK